MGHYKNFKTVVYCVAQWAEEVTKEELQNQIDYLQHYIGVDKVYLEPFRGGLQVAREKINAIRAIFEENGIEVAGGITTTQPAFGPGDENRQRIFDTFCYTTSHQRDKLREMSEYVASLFDEFIIDDFFFTNCTCENCRKAKDDKSWQEFRLALMQEVSENIILGPARKANPKVKVTIKFPNWHESYQEAGYNPKQQREIFDKIYTGTETRHCRHTEQHLPRYESYSIMRYLEHAAPGRNGGGWFDPYQCYPMEAYLEQAYLTALSRPQEIMMFCLPSVYDTVLTTPLGFCYRRLDKVLDVVGKPYGLPVYLPFNGRGEDHVEDFLGMVGIPFEATPDFPENAPAMFLTATAASIDPDCFSKVKEYVANGGKAIVTSGFLRAGLGKGMEDMTGLRDNGRIVLAEEFSAEKPGRNLNMEYSRSHERIPFRVFERSTNSEWTYCFAISGDDGDGIMHVNTYGKGKLITLLIPEEFAALKKLPKSVLTRIRYELRTAGMPYMDGPADISLFTYDNDTFVIYPYIVDRCAPERFCVHVAGEAKLLNSILTGRPVEPLYKRDGETVFELETVPGELMAWKIER